MGVPGSKIWSNLQLLSLFQSKYLKCGDCYDDNDGSQGLRVANTGDVIKTLTKAKKNMKREKYGNQRKHLGRICHPNSKKCSLCRFPLLTFSLKLSLVLFNIFVSKLEKIWTFDGKVTRCLQRRGEGHSGTPLPGSSQQDPPQFQILHMI